MANIDELCMKNTLFSIDHITKPPGLIHSLSESTVIINCVKLLEIQKWQIPCESSSLHVQKGLHSNKVKYSSPLQCDWTAARVR